MARLDLGLCTVILNGEEIGMTDDGFVEATATYEVVPSLLDGRVGPAQRIN